MGLNVLSLFDGMSCGRIALDRAGIQVDNYYASERDKYAIQVTQANWPNTTQLGDVTKWREWDIDWSSIDLLIGGSPCQGFSFAGKQLAFDDPRSALFFEYLNILEHIKSVNPNVKFMLENVKMKKEYLDVISRLLGVEPVFINSALVSAQNRQRYYWANWGFDQPEDKGLVLADVLQEEAEIESKMYYGAKSIEYMERGNEKWMKAGARRADRYTQTRDTEKAFTITANFHKGVPYNYFKCAQMVGRKINPETGKRDDYNKSLKTEQRLEIRSDNKTGAITTVQKDNLVVRFNDRVKGVTENERGYRYNKGDKAKSGISELGRILKSGAAYTDAVTTSHAPKLALNDDTKNLKYRKLTPVEVERLQTVPDNYTNHVSNTQRYKMLGNGWTVDVIAHILSSAEALKVYKA